MAEILYSLLFLSELDKGCPCSLINSSIGSKQFDFNARSIWRDMECIRRFPEDRVPENGIRKDLVYDHREKGYHLEQPTDADKRRGSDSL